MFYRSRVAGFHDVVALPPEVIGHVQTAIGSGTLTPTGGIAVQVKVGDQVCQGDVIETGADSRVGIRFIDGTTFDLSSSSRMVLNEFVCDFEGISHSVLFGVTAGTFAFIVGQLAKTGCLRIDTPVGSIRGRARTGGIGMLSLTALTFAVMKEVQAASSDVTFLDDGKITYSDLEHGVFELVTKDGRHIIVDNPGETIVLSGTGSVTVVTNSDARMAELQVAQQAALATYTLGITASPTSTGGGGSSTSPSLLLPSQGLQPINFIQPDAPNAPQSSPSVTTAALSVVGPPAAEAVIVHSAPPSPPSLTVVPGPTEHDTTVFDTFTATSGILAATNPNSGTTLTYGILGGATGGNTALGGVTYDVSETGAYGTLYLRSTTGAYTFVPNSGAINALTTTATENFVLTVSDGTLTSQEPFTVTLNGVNDVPTLAAVTGPTSTDTPVLDHFTAVTGTLSATDVDLPAQTLTYGIVGGTADLSLNGYNQSLVGTYGKLYVNTASGAYTFIPNDGAINALTAPTTENFTFTVSDGALSANQPFTVTLNGVNDAPVAHADVGAVNENATLTTTALTGVIQFGLGADTDVDNLTTSLLVSGAVAGTGAVTQGAGVATSLAGTYGHLTLAADGSYTYIADQAAADALANGVTANDVFTYTVKDPGGLVSNTTTLTITVTGTDDAPVAHADVGAVNENATLTTTALTGVIQFGLGADTDVDNLTTSLLVSGAVAGTGAVTQGAGVATLLAGTYGHLTLAADGSYTYIADQPAADALATGVTANDVFTYTVKDPDGLVSNTTTLTITVTGTDDAPVAHADVGAVNENATLTTTALTGVIQVGLGTDTDVDNLTTSLLVSGAVAGTGAVTQGVGVATLLAGTYGHLTLAADGSYTYIADQAAAERWPPASPPTTCSPTPSRTPAAWSPTPPR